MPSQKQQQQQKKLNKLASLEFFPASWPLFQAEGAEKKRRKADKSPWPEVLKLLFLLLLLVWVLVLVLVLLWLRVAQSKRFL